MSGFSMESDGWNIPGFSKLPFSGGLIQAKPTAYGRSTALGKFALAETALGNTKEGAPFQVVGTHRAMRECA